MKIEFKNSSTLEGVDIDRSHHNTRGERSKAIYCGHRPSSRKKTLQRFILKLHGLFKAPQGNGRD